MENPWKTISSDLRYDNPWISVTEHQIVDPGGQRGSYGTVHFKNFAIGILPVDNEGNTWLVGQYRYPLSRYSWEIPEGGGALAIDPLDSAKRELKEETGIEAKQWQKILDLHLCNSTTDVRSLIYLATDLSFGESRPDEGEDLVVRKVSMAEAYRMVLAGEITDAIAVAAVLYARAELKL